MERSAEAREPSESQPLVGTNTPESYFSLFEEAAKITGGTLPLAVVQTVGPLIGNIIISRIGDKERIATLMIFTFDGACTMIFNAPLMYLPTKAGEKIDQNTPELVGAEFQVGSLVAILCSVPQIIVLSFSGKISNLLGQDIEASKITQSFFYRYMFAMPFISLQIASDQISMVTKNVYPPVITYFATWTVGLTLSYLLANGYLGLPKMGINGVAIILASCSLLQYISYTAFLFYSSNRPQGWFAPYNLFKRHTGQLISLGKQLANGALMILAVGSVIGSMFFINMLAGRLGPAAASAQLVVSQYEEFMLIAGQAFSQTAQIQVSNRKTTKPKSIFRICVITSSAGLICSLLYVLATVSVPKQMMMPYFNPNDKNNADIVQILQNDKILLISSISTIFNILALIIGHVLMGIDKMAIPIIAGVIFNWSVMGLAYNFAKNSLDLNLFLAIGDLLNVLVAIAYFSFEVSRNFGIQTRPQSIDRVESQSADSHDDANPREVIVNESGKNDDEQLTEQTTKYGTILSFLFSSPKNAPLSGRQIQTAKQVGTVPQYQMS